MATESEKEALRKESPFSLESMHEDFCDLCLYSWCLFKKKIVYCSLRYKGEIGFICTTNSCKIK
ncbi:MAG: hypothetical protein KGD59_08585 [Candidatus Heimdallarchaeota archaeon]|nr:hypothetical protein [Candidatus Heimdallarchaeota archaeon]MBY8994593.1 hypothetical protein [Candidatus Heimdallarchaeota archaeon]